MQQLMVKDPKAQKVGPPSYRKPSTSSRLRTKSEQAQK